jgi:ATP-dependent Clp protease ATP-binding subunit ClpC
MFERFTDRARQVVVLAQEEARMLDHNYIGTEHILLALLREGEGVAAEALTALGIRLDVMRQAVEDIIGRGTQSPAGPMPFTPRSKTVFELSLREALSLGSDRIGTEHILLALLREGYGVGAQILVGAGVSLNRARQQIIDLLHRGPGEDAPSPPVSAPPLTVSAPPPVFASAAGDDLMSRLASFVARLNAIELRLSQSGEV